MTDQELLTYYSNLLIIQYANKPRAIATVQKFVNQLIASQIIQTVADGFDLETAIGTQLDAIGSYRGATRTIVGIDLAKTFFSLPTYSDPAASTLPGFAAYADGDAIMQYWAFYADGQNVAYVLTDADFRLLIQYLCELHTLDLTLKNIDDFLFKYFGTYVTLVDNGDMTMSFVDSPSDPSSLFKIAFFIGALPHPSGVEQIVTV